MSGVKFMASYSFAPVTVRGDKFYPLPIPAKAPEGVDQSAWDAITDQASKTNTRGIWVRWDDAGNYRFALDSGAKMAGIALAALALIVLVARGRK